ncbi:hypothetical protein VP01_306g4 [Puccinia sorghi]|uniref:Uncharacterized protein n=1 Tax=Puccinia sorghi TaxID=27349 RepID=A0A0L6V0K3_9BASI|nr:hypothetical protein VP01_306g4 [Puccinia sorghi]
MTVVAGYSQPMSQTQRHTHQKPRGGPCGGITKHMTLAGLEPTTTCERAGISVKHVLYQLSYISESSRLTRCTSNYHADTSTPAAPASQCEAIIAKLTQEIESLKSNPNKDASQDHSNRKSSNYFCFKEESPSRKDSSERPARNISPSVFLSKTPTKARKPPQETTILKPKPSPKQHPEKMQTADFPPGFTPTKTALFFYIEILWGLLRQDSVPKPPNSAPLKNFTNNFVKLNRLKTQSRVAQPAMSRTMRNSIIHLRSQFFTYAQGLISRLGLCVWCPNLDEESNSLVEREKQSFPRSKQQEIQQEPDKHLDLAILNKSPKQYQDFLEPLTAHSDDKQVEGKGFYKIKTLPYLSKNANHLFCHFPINFYDPKWYHGLLAQKESIPNQNVLSFLPNTEKSLFQKAQKHPDKKLGDSTFTKKYWDLLAKPYGLVGPGLSAEEKSAAQMLRRMRILRKAKLATCTTTTKTETLLHPMTMRGRQKDMESTAKMTVMTKLMMTL